MGKPAQVSLTVRRLPPGVKQRLRLRAAQHGRSLEAEARAILEAAANRKDGSGGEHLFDRIHRLFSPLGGVELKLPPRGPARRLPRFDSES